MSDDCFYIALKFTQGALDTTDGRSGYRYKPGARMYPTRQPASGMRRRWLGEGYDARLARLWIDDDGNPQVEYCDQNDNIKPVCRAVRHQRPGRDGWSRKCVLDAGHSGWHSTKRKPDRYSEFQADA